MFDVFRWIGSFPRFGNAPPNELVKQMEQRMEQRVSVQPGSKAADTGTVTGTGIHTGTTEELFAHEVFRKFGMHPGLERMQEILRRLGDPQLALRFIHIAGTNGKGSTAAFLAAMLNQAGIKTGLYTSPYLTEFHDRMGVNGKPVATEHLAKYAERLLPIVEDVKKGPYGTPTEFEIVTLLAILYFAEEHVDAVVWETGLGGRLDATNVVQPIATIITNIGLEHTEILGNTEELIAREKAGIVKPYVPLFTAASGKAFDVIQTVAAGQEAPVYVYGRDFSLVREWSDESGQRGVFRVKKAIRGLVGVKDVYGITMHMHGVHQTVNAALAIAAYQWCMQHVFFAQQLLPVVSEGNLLQREEFVRNTVRVGVRMMSWAGRFEVVLQNPLWILDGAHNPHGAKALARTLQEWQERKRRSIILILGILRDKDVENILKPILPLVAVCIATQPENPRAMPAEQLAGYIRTVWNGQLEVAPTVLEALQIGQQLLQSDDLRENKETSMMNGNQADGDMVVCMGSLYTISEARKHIKNRM